MVVHRPTRPNTSGKATAEDAVMTPPNIAKRIIKRYNPRGLILEPAKGTGSFYNQLPEPKAYCEIAEGKDFFNWHDKVDWIITNPPYSIYDRFIRHCFEVADNIVLLVPIVKCFKSIGILKDVNNYGGLKEIWVLGSGTKCGFKIGFPVGCLYYQRGYGGKVNVEYDFIPKNQTKLSLGDTPEPQAEVGGFTSDKSDPSGNITSGSRNNSHKSLKDFSYPQDVKCNKGERLNDKS